MKLGRQKAVNSLEVSASKLRQVFEGNIARPPDDVDVVAQDDFVMEVFIQHSGIASIRNQSWQEVETMLWSEYK